MTPAKVCLETAQSLSDRGRYGRLPFCLRPVAAVAPSGLQTAHVLWQSASLRIHASAAHCACVLPNLYSQQEQEISCVP